MATHIRHRKTRIVTLEQGEELMAHCKPNDIAIVPDPDGWWTCFIAEDGSVDKYDIPFPTYNEALWSAKAAAEFAAE
ncbi:hypothetical protein ACHMW6_08085 [Pseudoduganella sp. UC29_106]|uniref:hypothetical protein n=1 Tax=Pseudoduganella sp. UC29_106 TaxID=3374553 RepID=UPI003757B0BC